MQRRSAGLALAAWAAWALSSKSQAAAGPALEVTRPMLARFPAVELRSMDGARCMAAKELALEVPLVMTFVFTTCSTSCSVQTALLAEVQRERSLRKQPLRLASITIDPDNDTPEQLRRFAMQHKVGPGWQFYTGKFDDLLVLQRHFDVYRGSKAAHPPVLLMRRNAQAPWVRIEGFPSVRQVVDQIERLPAA